MILTVTPNPCVDKTVYIEHLEPGGRYRAERCGSIAGGKGTNVSRAVRAMGRETRALLLVGGPTGRHVVDMVTQEDNLPCIPVWVNGMTRTITTVLESAPHRQTAFFEPGPAVSAEEREVLVAAFRETVQGARVVTLCGTVPHARLRNLYAVLIPIAREAGAITVLDTHGAELRAGLAAHPDFIKPNLEEAAEYLGKAADAPGLAEEAVGAFHAAGVGGVVLSLGRGGAIFSHGGRAVRAVPPVIEEVNPVGSGDSLVALLAIGLAEGWALEEIARNAVAAGAANAASWKIAHISRGEVESMARQVEVVAL